MAHALVWTQIDSTDLSSEIKREIPFAGFGTIVANSWNKRIFKLKWQNASVENIKVWLDEPFADIYTTTEFPVIKKQRLLSLIDDLGFDFRITPLDTFNIISLPNAKAASNLNLPTVSIAGTTFLESPYYIDGAKIEFDDLVLIKNQTDSIKNGLYKVNFTSIGTGSTYFYAEEKVIAGKIVASGSSSFYSYMENLKPGEFALIGSTNVIWVDRYNTYQLKNVVSSTNSNLQTSGSALTNNSILLDNVTLELNDRILVKNQDDGRQNGIYYVSSLYAANKNSIINPNTSTNFKDSFWDTALYNIYNGIPVSAQVLFGSTLAGSYFRFFKSDDAVIIPYSILGDGDSPVTDPDDSPGINPGGNSGLGQTLNSSWTDATHFYERYYTTWYYEIGTGTTSIFSSGTGNTGTLSNLPCELFDYLNNSTLTAVGQSILVKHYIPELSGIYYIDQVDCATGSTWKRKPDFSKSEDFTPQIVYTENNRSEIGSPIFYLGKTLPYNKGNEINQEAFTISPRYINWFYEPVSNLITKNIEFFNRVNEKFFDNSGIAISQRVLVTGQATTSSQNGIYIVSNSSFGSTLGLDFYNYYWIKNASIANSAGSNDSFLLYSDQENVSFGSAGVTFLNISSAATTSVQFYIASDKIASGYISPDDFGSDVLSGDRILLNTGIRNSNAGVYTAIVGSPHKKIFNYPDGFKSWFIDIYRNILSNYKSGTYTVSPNLKKQTDSIYVARRNFGFGETTLSNRTYGNIYTPQIFYPITENSTSYFDQDYLGSALIQETPVNWTLQNHQSYVVKGIWYKNNFDNFPNESGTAVSSKLFDGTIIQNNDDVLVWIGNNSAVANTYNGIWRAVSISGAGSSVFFKKHEDFNFNTKYLDGTNLKVEANPYERPTKVLIQNGHFIAGSSFGYTAVYMQGEIGYRNNLSVLGSTAITSYDENQYNAGQETFNILSNIRLSRDYAGIGTFSNLAPIQHIVNNDTSYKDTVDGDILILSRGNQLFTLNTSTNIKYYFEVGDRVIYIDDKEQQYLSTSPNFISAIYQIVYINENTWTYYLRKVKQSSSYGHLDHYKRLDVHPSNTIEDVTFSIIKYGGDGTTYVFNQNNYNSIDIFTINSSGITTSYSKGIDFDITPNLGSITRISSFGLSTDQFYCYIKTDEDIPSYNEISKSLQNNFYLVKQVLVDKENLFSGAAISSSSYNFENIYFQLSYSSGNFTSTDFKNNTDRNHWYNKLNPSKIYSDEIKYLVSTGSTNDYFITSRLSQDGYFLKGGSAFTASYFDENIFQPGTGKTIGIFTGNFYVEKLDQINSGISVSYWYDNLTLSSNDKILIINNNSSLIAETFQTNYYNDNNILVKHISSGKNDQKVISFEKDGYYPVSLYYDSSMTNPLTPLKVTAGLGTYILHYNPIDNSINSSTKNFYELSGLEQYNCNISTVSNLTNLDDLGGNINSFNLSSGNLVLVKNQSNTFENGIYSVINNRLFSLTRSADLDESSDIKLLSQVYYGKQNYELILPFASSYSIGDTAGHTSLIWKKVGFGQTIDIAMVTLTNFSGSALSYSFPDSYGGYTFEEDDKILLFGQTDETQRYIGRFVKTIEPTFTRVTSSIATTSGFAITNCFVYDENRNKYWELYFNPDQKTIGVGTIHWIEQNTIENYINCTFKTDENVSFGNTPSFTNEVFGNTVLIKNQSDPKQNGIYYIDSKRYYYLTRHQNLNTNDEVIPNYKINVISGFNNTGFYALSYDESNNSSLIGSTSIFWANVKRNNVLLNCGLATTDNINLTNPPTKIDNVLLENDFRILVKNQTTKSQNGIYIVKDKDKKTWVRATDLDDNLDLQPQLSVKVDNGDNNSDNIFRIKIRTPRNLTNSNTSEYIIDTDDIEWQEIDALDSFEQSPSKWQKIGLGSTESLFLGSANMDKFYTSKSSRFAIAIKAPTTSKFASIGISENGKVRNLKFKVEYNIKED